MKLEAVLKNGVWFLAAMDGIKDEVGCNPEAERSDLL
jgi:hypothetical protein